MSEFKKFMLCIAALALLGMGLDATLGSRQVQGSGGAPVIVTNTPLPVSVSNTPNVNIANTVSATQNGTWNVGISNTSASPISVRDVDNAAHNAVQGFCEITALTAGSNSCTVTLYTQSSGGTGTTTVPSGYELVIETVSSETGLATGIKGSCARGDGWRRPPTPGPARGPPESETARG